MHAHAAQEAIEVRWAADVQLLLVLGHTLMLSIVSILPLLSDRLRLAWL